jgi:hypothetical protein
MSPDEGTSQDAAAARKMPSDPVAIEQLIAHRRANLASTIDELAQRARPKEIARRSAADAKGRIQAFARTDDGALRIERLAAVAGAVAALVTVLTVLRRRAGRSAGRSR